MSGTNRNTYEQLEREASDYVVGRTDSGELVLGLRDAMNGLGFVTPEFVSLFNIVHTEPLDVSRPEHAHFVPELDRLHGRNPGEAAAHRETAVKQKLQDQAARDERTKQEELRRAAEKAEREANDREIQLASEKLIRYQETARKRYSAVGQFFRGLAATQLLFVLPLLWWGAVLVLGLTRNIDAAHYKGMRHDLLLVLQYAPWITLTYAFLFWNLARHRRRHPMPSTHKRDLLPRNTLLIQLQMLAFALLIHLQFTILCSTLGLLIFDWVYPPLNMWQAMSTGYFGLHLDPFMVAIVPTLLYLRLFTLLYRPVPFYPTSPKGSLPGAHIFVLAVGLAVAQMALATSDLEYTAVILLGTAALAVVILSMDFLTFKAHGKQAKTLDLNDNDTEKTFQNLAYWYQHNAHCRRALKAFMERNVMLNAHFTSAVVSAGQMPNDDKYRVISEPLGLAS